MAKTPKTTDADALADADDGLIDVTVVSRQSPARYCIQRAFTAEPVQIRVTPEQLDELDADAMLVVIRGKPLPDGGLPANQG